MQIPVDEINSRYLTCNPRRKEHNTLVNEYFCHAKITGICSQILHSAKIYAHEKKNVSALNVKFRFIMSNSIIKGVQWIIRTRKEGYRI